MVPSFHIRETFCKVCRQKWTCKVLGCKYVQLDSILPNFAKNYQKFSKVVVSMSIVLEYFPQMKIYYRRTSEVIQVQFHTTNITIRQGTHLFGFAEHVRSDVCIRKVVFLYMYTAICIQTPPPSGASLQSPSPDSSPLGHHRALS